MVVGWKERRMKILKLRTLTWRYVSNIEIVNNQQLFTSVSVVSGGYLLTAR